MAAASLVRSPRRSWLKARQSAPSRRSCTPQRWADRRIAVTSEEAITLSGSDEPGTALPGQGTGKVAEPILDKLSALIAAMNDKYGSDLGEADKVWVDQQWTVIKEHTEMRAVAVHNDRSQFEMVLEQKIKDLLVDRHEKNGVLFDMFFANPDFQNALIRHLAGTYDEFRTEAAG